MTTPRTESATPTTPHPAPPRPTVSNTHQLPTGPRLPLRHGRPPHKHRRHLYNLPQHPPRALLRRSHGMVHQITTARSTRTRSYRSAPHLGESQRRRLARRIHETTTRTAGARI